MKPEDVGDCFGIDFATFQPSDNPKMVEFSDYLVETYIAEDSLFPPSLWAEHSSSLQRTTNACESFHARFNQSFYHAHPHIFQFIAVILDFQCDTYVKIRSINNHCKKTYSSKALSNKTFLDDALAKVANGKLNKLNFVKLVGNHFKL